MAGHPGKTVTQRRVLDAIGIGKPVGMSSKTEGVMVKAGMIVRTGMRVLARDRFGDIAVPTYEMTPATHLQWTDYWVDVAEKDGTA